MARDPGGSSGSARRLASDLELYPRASLAVDVAVLTVTPGPSSGADADRQELGVLLLRRAGPAHEGEWGLPGSMVRERERLGDAVIRTLDDKCGIRGLAPRQLRVFDDPERDERGWVVSVAHVDVVPASRLSDALAGRDDLAIVPVDAWARDQRAPSAGVTFALRRGPGWLPFDHDAIVELAVADTRARYEAAPDPAGLVPEPFTLLGLRRVHEAVLGEPLQKDTFRRRVQDHLRDTGELSDGTVGRPARLFRRR